MARTMRLAQRLYEGKEIGDSGQVGLVTYMRTDSTRVSEEALEALRGEQLDQLAQVRAQLTVPVMLDEVILSTGRSAASAAASSAARLATVSSISR